MILVSRTRLETFLLCQRRFQLRYLTELPWPEPPVSESQAAARLEGDLLHQLIAQHYMGVSLNIIEAELPPPVRGWWRNFQQTAPVPAADEQVFVELNLTVPVGEFLLIGRFDLLLVGPERVRIFDWKTGPPRSKKELVADWQTRMYFGLISRGSQALGLHSLSAERIEMIYWYSREPAASQKISYSDGFHRRNWAEIEEILGTIGRQRTDGGSWPLTENLTICARCAYQVYCGRTEVPPVSGLLADETADGEDDRDDNESLWRDVVAMEPGQT